ncbi:MAG: tetratricopeptide repeat protein [Candidatus Aminicenantes bacterium]|nr:MAG: tetratricopeptide repeat protein [Candidatus Aminicenantes bacterium]
MLVQQFYENKKFHDFLHSNFILYQATRGVGEGDAVYERYSIRATPTVLVLGSDGSEIDWHVGYGPPPEKFLERVEKTVNGIDNFKLLSEKYAKRPKNVEVVFKLAQKYDDRFNEEKAKELYNKVLALDPNGKKGTTEYNDEQVTYTEYAEFSLGTLALYSRPGSPEPFKAFIKKYPESKMLRSVYSYLGSYYRRAGSKEDATQFFEEYISKYPDNPSVLNTYVQRIISDKDNIDKGIELAEKIKEIMRYNPGPSYMRNLAELYSLKGEKEKVNEVYGKDFMEGRISRLVYDLRDYVNFWVGQESNTESVLDMMELAVKMAPDNFYVVRAVADIYVKLDKPEKALEVFGPDCVKAYMDDSNSLYSYARFWGNLGKNLESALEAAKKSVELAEAPYKWDTLSLVYLKLKKYDEAMKAAEKAVETAGDQAGRYEKRIEEIKKAKDEERK